MAGIDGFDITGDFAEMAELVKGLKSADDVIERATVSAVNKTTTSVRAEAVRLIRKDYRVRAKDVRNVLKIKRATFRNPVATLYGAQKPGIPLADFYPTPNRVPSTIHKRGVWNTRTMIINGRLVTKRVMVEGSDRYLPKRGIKVMVRKGSRKQVRTAFIQKMKSGHVGVFRPARNGRMSIKSKKTVIEELYGPSPIRMLDSDRIQIPLDEFAGEMLDKNMAHEAEHYLKKQGCYE